MASPSAARALSAFRTGVDRRPHCPSGAIIMAPTPRLAVHDTLGSCTARRGIGHDHGQWGNAGGRLEPLLDRVHTTALATTSSTSVNRSCRSPSRCRSGLNRSPRPPRMCELLDRILAGVLEELPFEFGGEAAEARKALPVETRHVADREAVRDRAKLDTEPVEGRDRKGVLQSVNTIAAEALAEV